MKIATKEALAIGIVVATIALIAVAGVWANSEVKVAEAQSTTARSLVRLQSDLRMLTFEYVLHREERAHLQWRTVSERIDALIANDNLAPGQLGLLSEIRARRSKAKLVFENLTASSPDDRRHVAQLVSQLLISQQENLAGAFQLIDRAAERISMAQRQVMTVTFAGLALITLVMAGLWLLIHRNILGPLVRLQRGAQQIASGNQGVSFEIGGNDEISLLAQSLDSMTVSLRDAVGQVERTNKGLAAVNHELEAFSYSVSHDLRAPLRSMDGFALLLLQDYGDKLDAEGQDALERIRAASQRMGRLIDDLLALSQLTRAELKVIRVDVSAMARELAESIGSEAPGRSVEWKIEDGVAVVADKAMMQIAMQNLMQNAWKFTGKTPKPVIRIGAEQREGKQVIVVSDNGAGFDMAYADRLFGAFQRLHHASDFPGTGIGLAIVQRAVHRNNGSIWAEAKLGQGASFLFTVG